MMPYLQSYPHTRRKTMACLIALVAATWFITPAPVLSNPAAAAALDPQQDSEIAPAADISVDDFPTKQCVFESAEMCRYHDIIVLAARRHEVETALVMAIIHAESRYDAEAVSRRGARGLMQLMPRTAEALGVTDSFDPQQNVDAGVRYFKRLLEVFEGDRDLALAAYNAGLKNVFNHGGIPPFPATRIYLRKVWAWYDRYKALEQRLSAPPEVAVRPSR